MEEVQLWGKTRMKTTEGKIMIVMTYLSSNISFSWQYDLDY